MRIEYRVRPVIRHVVTCWHDDEAGGQGVETKGEFDSHDIAYQVAYALCKEQHNNLGYPPGDERVRYPEQRNIAGFA